MAGLGGGLLGGAGGLVAGIVIGGLVGGFLGIVVGTSLIPAFVEQAAEGVVKTAVSDINSVLGNIPGVNFVVTEIEGIPQSVLNNWSTYGD